MLTSFVALRIEWALSRVRAMRWREEVQLLCEEMRWAMAYFGWKACWWKDCQGLRTAVDANLQEGLSAYALEHALLFQNIGKECQRCWDLIIELAKNA